MHVKKCLLLLLMSFFFLSAAGFAQSAKELAGYKKELSYLKKEIVRLEAKLKKTSGKEMRTIIIDKIDNYRKKIGQLQEKIGSSKSAAPQLLAPTYEALATTEAGQEEGTGVQVAAERTGPRLRLPDNLGGVMGMYVGSSAFLGEMRFPTGTVFGPSWLSFRIAAGLAQSADSAHRYLPLNFDLIFNFPPGWFTGVANYIGGGMNYVLLTESGSQGTVGAQLFYGIESEVGDAKMFGELGYGALRTGTFPSQKGVTVMVGYRRGR